MSNYKVNPQIQLESNVIQIGDQLYAVGGLPKKSNLVSLSGSTSGEYWYNYPASDPVDMDGYRIESLGNPVADTDAVNKLYVDQQISTLEQFGYSDVFNQISELRSIVPDVILSTSGAGDLNTAIGALTSGQTLEIQSSAVFSSITIPSGVEFKVKVADGYFPTISGQECIKIADGASGVLLSSLIIEGCTTSYQNGRGSAITFATNYSKASDLIFHNVTIRDAQGSAVLLAYYNGGDYATAPTLSQMSSNISFIGCHLHKATTDRIEGGAICLRGMNSALVCDCYIDSANQGRGMHLQNCINLVIEECYVNNCDDGNGGEGIKLDQLGTIYGYRNSATIRNNRIKRCIEGIDIDDVTSVNVIQNNTISECSGECISVDDTGLAALIGNTCYNSNRGIRVESGAVVTMKKNVCYNNTTDYLIQNGYTLDDSNTISLDDTFVESHASITKNDSTVSGTTVKDALEVLNTPLNGSTGGRPGSPSSGLMYFDTTLGIPVWYDGSNWVNCSGVSV